MFHRFPNVVAAVTLCSILFAVPARATDAIPATDSSFSSRYTAVTKKILLAGLDIERFSLNYRLEQIHNSPTQKLVYFGTQEAGAACGLAFEITAVKEFNNGRHRLLSLNPHALYHGLRAAEVGSIVAASGSTFALASNLAHSIKGARKGFDTHTANRYINSRLKEFDILLAERERLVTENKNDPAYERAILEGKILECLRGTFVNEYANFTAGSRSAISTQNLFLLLNTAYNTVGAVAADVGARSINKPKLNGPSNILFTVTGALAAASPLICSAHLFVHRRLILHYQRRNMKGSEAALAELSEELKKLAAESDAEGTLIPSLPSTQRFAIYNQSDHLFTKQLENETSNMRHLNKVAVQTSSLGPVIGSLLMTQGILGTKGFYDYFPQQPKKQLDLSYKGAICGTVGTSIAVVGNVAWMLASMSYEHHLKKNHRLPEQLIRDRLAHLDEVEKTVQGL